MDVHIVQAGERMGLGLEKMNLLECVRGDVFVRDVGLVEVGLEWVDC